MHLFYSQTIRPPEGAAYRNPRHFAGVEEGATLVTLDGDWPAIVAAYSALGVEVSPLHPAPEPPAIAEPPPSLGGERPQGFLDTVIIPEDWRDLPYRGAADTLTLRQLAALISPEPVFNKAQAVEIIEAEVGRRASAE